MEENNKNNEPLNKDFKEPKLRFPEYAFPLKKTKLIQISTINAFRTKEIPDQFWYIDLEAVKNRKYSAKLIQKKEAPSRAKRKLKYNDILFSCVRPYLKNNVIFNECDSNYVGSTGFAIIESENPYFLLNYLETPRIQFEIKNRCTGSSYPAISAEDLSLISLYVPETNEQHKIGTVFKMIDKKMTNITQKISILKKYKEGLIKTLIKSGDNEGYLSEHVVVEEKTRLPSSFGKPCGSYPFFINNDEKIEKYCDSYIFDGTYLILNTGGCASIKFYEGKFSAMSDCLVLKPKRNPAGLYFFLKAEEKKINQIGFQGTGLRHLDQNWLFRQMVCLPPISEDVLECLNDCIDQKISTMEEEVKLCEKIKNFLLVNMFI